MQFPKLNSQQLERLSEFFGNLGLIFFASFVVPVFSPETRLSLLTGMSGVVLSSGCVIVSLIMVKGGGE